jgi:sterol desaturase/sphingolipid hydroxylase (fatty acid hydroxylase superfamily)
MNSFCLTILLTLFTTIGYTTMAYFIYFLLKTLEENKIISRSHQIYKMETRLAEYITILASTMYPLICYIVFYIIPMYDQWNLSFNIFRFVTIISVWLYCQDTWFFFVHLILHKYKFMIKYHGRHHKEREGMHVFSALVGNFEEASR